MNAAAVAAVGMGAALGGGFLLAVRAAYLRFRGTEGLGLGDVKMLAMIGAFKVYVPMMIMTPGGGPSGTTSTLVYFLYEEGFMSWRLGYASAIAYVLFVIILAMTLLQNKVIGGKVHYE